MTSKDFDQEKKALEIQNLKYWSDYYFNENKELEIEFKKLDIKVSDLSEKSYYSLNRLVNMAQKMQLDDCVMNDVSILLALSNYAKQKYCEDLKIIKLKDELNDWTEKLYELNLMNGKLSADVEYIEASIREHQEIDTINKTKAKIKFTNEKLEQYKSKLESHETSNRLIDDTLKHDSIIKAFNDCKLVEQSISDINLNLSTYHELPPNLTQAKIKLQELKDEITEINASIDKYLKKEFTN
jgi:hypothetical protein